MASKSFQKAQLLLTCELCETDTKIQWKCTDCNLFLCDKCKNKVHSKIKKAKDHIIITIKEVGLHRDDPRQKLDFSDIQCKDHSGQVCCLFCKTCDHLVCPTGVTKIHKQHELVEIDEALRLKMDELKARKKKLEKQHDDWINNIEILNTIKETEQLKTERTQKSILKQKQVWREAGDQYAEELGSENKKQWKAKVKAIETECRKVTNFEDHLLEEIQLIEGISMCKDVSKFLEDTKSLGNFKEMPKVNLNFSQLPTFVPGQILLTCFGSMQEEIHKDKTFKIEAIEEYTTELL